MLEKEIDAFVARAIACYPDDALARSPDEQRRLYERFAAACAPAMPDGVSVGDASLVSRAGHRIALRRYRATAGIARGTVLFFHGGGFVVGSLDSHHAIAARIAADTRLDVIAVAYRLAPEHRAPAAHDDCLEAASAALDGRLPFGALPRPLMLAGDSAGGTLAAGVAASLHDRARHGHAVAAVALVYPMLGLEPQPPARDTEADAPLLTRADVDGYRRLYWGDAPAPPGTVPLDAADFSRLPPTLAIGVEHDPLRDDARVYADRVRAAGGDARFWLGQGLVHGAWRALDASPQAARLHRAVCDFLIEHAAR